MTDNYCLRCADLEKKIASLEKTNAEYVQFEYIVSHDLKAPLRAIESLSEWLEEELGAAATSDVKKYMEMLRTRVRRMDAMLAGLREYSNIGRREVSVEAFKSEEVIQDVISSSSFLSGNPTSFAIEFASGLPTLTGARAHFEQVLRNLIGNAMQHHDKPQGTIVISAQALGNFYEFTVADDGPGIPVKYQKKVFDIFQTLQEDQETLGMGLALTKKIIEEQGGAILLESDTALGSVFRFTWPTEALSPTC